MASSDGSGYSVQNAHEVERMYQKFTFKCLQIIVQSRIEKAEFIKDKTHYDHCDFGLMLPDNAQVDEQIRKSLQGTRSYPLKEQSICMEVSLVTNDGDHMFLEMWDMTFDPSSVDVAVSKPQHIYTRMGVTLKSLVCATRATPAYTLARNQGERGGGFRLSYRFYLGKPRTSMLGEGFKSYRAGAVPSNSGLLGINVSFRTRLLLSPNTSHSQRIGIEMQDNHFRQDACTGKVLPNTTKPSSPCATRHVASHKTRQTPSPSTHHVSSQVSPPSTRLASPITTHQVSPHSKPHHASSMPQPCSSPHKSPDHQSDSPYFFAVSPGADRDEDFLRAHMAAANKDDRWSNHSLSVFAMDDLPEPILGAFADPKMTSVPEVTSSDLYQSLLRRSQIAQEMVTTLCQQKDVDTEDHIDGKKTHIQREMEKENIPTTGRHNLSMEEVEEDFIMVSKPPFAEEEDPNDVKCFLGLIFQAPVMSFEDPGGGVTVEDFVSDVSKLVDKSEGEMAELDRFCQSVVSQGDEERDTSPDG